MELTGEYRIPAPRQTVWEALNDPNILRQCIPGCEELERTGPEAFAAKVRAKIGPVSARFTGEVTLSDMDPPNGYRISGEGKGGAAGFAKGGARVNLTEDGGATVLRYDADAQVGGKLAQLGSRLVAGSAKKIADDFFTRFSEIVGPAGGAATTPPGATAAADGGGPVPGSGGAAVSGAAAAPAASPAAPSAPAAAAPPPTSPGPAPAPSAGTVVPPDMTAPAASATTPAGDPGAGVARVPVEAKTDVPPPPPSEAASATAQPVPPSGIAPTATPVTGGSGARSGLSPAVWIGLVVVAVAVVVVLVAM